MKMKNRLAKISSIVTRHKLPSLMREMLQVGTDPLCIGKGKGFDGQLYCVFSRQSRRKGMVGH